MGIWRSGSENLLAAPVLTVRRERKGRPTDDDIRPAILALSTAGSLGHLQAELATRPLGARPGDLMTALGTDAVLGRARRTHQWIERDGARFEPLPWSGLEAGDVATQDARRDPPHVRDQDSAGPRRVAALRRDHLPESRPPEGAEGASPQASRHARPAPRKPKIGDTRPAPARHAAAEGRGDGRAGRPVGTTRLHHQAEGGRDRRGQARRGRKLGADRRSRRGRQAQPGGGVGRGRTTGAARSRRGGTWSACTCSRTTADPDRHARGGRSLVMSTTCPGRQTTQNQIDGNVYRGRVQNVLPGMEAAFVDIGIPKNAVLYRGDVRYDKDDIEGGASQQPPDRGCAQGRTDDRVPGDEEPDRGQGRTRLTQEVSLPGRFAVLVPNSSAFGISKRLGDNERRRLRRIIDEVKPAGHGMFVRTAAEGVTAEELQRDVTTLVEQWNAIEAESKKSNAPGLLYREPDLAVRILREELNAEYAGRGHRRPGAVRAGTRLRVDRRSEPGPGRAGRVLRHRGRGAADLRAAPRARAAAQSARSQGVAGFWRLADHRANRSVDGD